MPITKPNQVSIAVKRLTSRASDGAGGYLHTWTGPNLWTVTVGALSAGAWLQVNGIRFTLLDGGEPEDPWTLESGDVSVQFEPSAAEIVDLLVRADDVVGPEDPTYRLGWLRLCGSSVTYSASGLVITVTGASAVTASEHDTFSVVAAESRTFTGRLLRKAIRSTGMTDAPQGDIVRDEVVLVFEAGTDIRAGDICTVDHVEYTVERVRSYKRSLQADVLAVS